MRPNRSLVVAAMVALLLVGFVMTLGSEGAEPATPVESDQSTGRTTVIAAEPGPSEVFSDLRSIAHDELPIEALETLLLIDDGGPFPFDRDDQTFQNREGLLPDRPIGHYREYTVITPGENDRGARRIVAGADGERYYTADHYASFREIAGPGAGQ